MQFKLSLKRKSLSGENCLPYFFHASNTLSGILYPIKEHKFQCIRTVACYHKDHHIYFQMSFNLLTKRNLSTKITLMCTFRIFCSSLLLNTVVHVFYRIINMTRQSLRPPTIAPSSDTRSALWQQLRPLTIALSSDNRSALWHLHALYNKRNYCIHVHGYLFVPEYTCTFPLVKLNSYAYLKLGVSASCQLCWTQKISINVAFT